MQRLDQFDNSGFDRGRPRWVELCWLLLGSPLVRSGLPGSAWRRALLRLFGARIGRGVVIKPGVHVKFPWRLEVGDHSWLGEKLWIDNLATVSIGSHCCLSQGVYLCTGSHDWSRPGFDLRVAPVRINDGAWLAACCRIAPGVTIEREAVVQMGAVVTRNVAERMRVAGNPAREAGARE